MKKEINEIHYLLDIESIVRNLNFACLASSDDYDTEINVDAKVEPVFEASITNNTD